MELVPAYPEPVLQVAPHRMPGDRCQPQVVRERGREANDVGRRSDQHHAVRREPVAQRQRHGGAAERMADDPVDRADFIAHGAERPRELGQRGEAAGGLAVRRTVIGDDPKPRLEHAAPMTLKRPARLPHPWTSTTVGPVAPLPGRQFLPFARHRESASRGEERVVGRPRLVPGRGTEDGLRPAGGDARRHRAHRREDRAQREDARRRSAHRCDDLRNVPTASCRAPGVAVAE